MLYFSNDGEIVMERVMSLGEDDVTGGRIDDVRR